MRDLLPGAVLVAVLTALLGSVGALLARMPVAAAEEEGLTAQVCRWFDGKTAAISVRFDDSDPSHLRIAIPVLNEYGLVGTFMINPGCQDYAERREEWEAAVKAGGHELANHTMHHRGAQNDEEADYEIGECSRYIWSVFPEQSKLLAFNSGGGTNWTMARPWSYYYEKWHLFRPGRSASVTASPLPHHVWDLEMFKEVAEKTIAEGESMSFYFHRLGAKTDTVVSEDTFREMVVYLASRRDQVWCAGLAQIHKYETERKAAKVEVKIEGPDRATVGLACGTDPEFYDQPLTLELSLPAGWRPEAVRAQDAEGKAVQTRMTVTNGRSGVRFEAAPRDAKYAVSQQ